MSSFAPQRRYDHIYDPVYTVSSSADHARISKQTAVQRVEKIPDATNYFSEIPAKYATHSYRVSTKQELPGHVDVGFRAQREQGGKTVSSAAQVSGKHRAQHFAMPHRPSLRQPAAATLLAQSVEGRAKQKNIMGHGTNRLHAQETSGPITKQTQTRLRESEAQTDPYSPEYVVADGEDPEVLSLAGLRFGQGLPISMTEVELIERARAKKAFLNTLPPITDEASFNLRKKMMEEQELSDLHFRERKLEELHEAQLAALREALADRTRERERIAAQRVASVMEEKSNEKDDRIAIIQRARLKALRKLKLAQMVAQAKAEETNLGPKTGKLDTPPLSDELSFATLVPETLNGIEALEKSLHASAFEPKAQRLKAQLGHHSLSQERRKRVLCLHLDRMDKLIKSRKYGGTGEHSEAEHAAEDDNQDEDLGLPEWRRKVEKMARPPTPCIEQHTSFISPPDELHQAIVLLQRLLRGRAMQSMMYEGKESRLQLIKELRFASSESAQAKSDTSKLRKKAAALAAREAVVGEIVSFTLDLYSKDLKRSKQEVKVEQVISEAQETRRWREMNEAGRRQREWQQREAREQKFNRINKLHQHTATSYYDDALGEAIDTAASIRAKEITLRTKATTQQSIDDKAKETADDAEGEEIDMEEMLCNVVFPHVVLELAREAVQKADKSFTNAAIDALESALHETVDFESVGGGLDNTDLTE